MNKENILQNIFWSFIGEKYPDLKSFDIELKDYADYMEVEHIKNDTAIVAPKVTIFYEDFAGEDDDIEFTLNADNNVSFGTVELLYKIHNHLVENLRDKDYHFFEGLTLSEEEDGQPPMYNLDLGS